MRSFPLPKPVWKTLLLGCLLSITMTAPGLPVAAQGRRYNPPGGPPPRTAGVGGARSGSCTGAADTVFTALAPYSEVGQTAATHPTFAWYVPDSQSPEPDSQSPEIDFRLYAYGADGRLQPEPVYRTMLPSTQGVMTFTLPPTEPGLTRGQHYYWQAALICDPNHRSEDAIINAEMRTVEDSVPESERWYDLLRSEPDSVTNLLSELASIERSWSENLARSAETVTEDDRRQLLELSQDVLQHSQNLTQIIEAEI
ncbi:MAG: hypothetical protein Kow00121_36540 [Elainellaceae cyanobacterium]